MCNRLTKLDDLYLPDHCRLDESDECFYLGEYTARKDWSHSATNQLIYNLKKSPERKTQRDWPYKGKAIRQVAAAICRSVPGQWLSSVVLIPMPPSKDRNDSLYDDRMLQVLIEMQRLIGRDLDIRELIIQQGSTVAAHSADHRPTVSDLMEKYEVDDSLLAPAPSKVVIVDDVLTTGAHFKAAKNILLEEYPEIDVYGFFAARRVPETEDIETIDLDALFGDL